jgi:hypothetical protein
MPLDASHRASTVRPLHASLHFLHFRKTLSMTISHRLRRHARTALAWMTFGAAMLALPAHAVPSYARQTGMECSGCHVGAYGPQLTPAGIRFKLGGYTDTDGKEGKFPFSGMLLADYSHTKKPQDPPPDHLKANDNVTFDQASLFIAGGAGSHFGGFMQLTYDGVARNFGLDNTDVRAVTTTELAGAETILGLSVNNNPTVQDPFNTLSAWGYPFVAPAAGFGAGDSATLINGGLGGIVLGLSGYMVWNKDWYAELGSYRSMSPSTQSSLGLGRDEQRLEGNAYWRLAYMHDLKSAAWHVGLFGWTARLDPDRTLPGPVDSHRDVGIDAAYQFLGTREHVWTVFGSLTNEFTNNGADGSHAHLNEKRLNASYHWNETWGLSGGLFGTDGSDPTATTRGLLMQADWTPWGKEAAEAPAPIQWLNLKFGAQYWHYGTFDGTHTGAGDHDTFSVFAWSTF